MYYMKYINTLQNKVWYNAKDKEAIILANDVIETEGVVIESLPNTLF